MKFLFDKRAIVQTPDGSIKTIHRKELVNKPDAEVVKIYNSEIRGILNYYCLSGNYVNLNYFSYLMEYSCLKTLARKHKTSVRKIINRYRDGHRWSVPNGSSETSRIGIVNFYEHQKKFYGDVIKEYRFYGHKSVLWKRIEDGRCELCNVIMERPGVVHMVRKLKDLGNAPWDKLVKKMRRKTLVVCHECHNIIHAVG